MNQEYYNRLFESLSKAGYADPEGQATRLAELAENVLKVFQDKKWHYPEEVALELNHTGIYANPKDVAICCSCHYIYWGNLSSHTFERGDKYKLEYKPLEHEKTIELKKTVCTSSPLKAFFESLKKK